MSIHGFSLCMRVPAQTDIHTDRHTHKAPNARAISDEYNLVISNGTCLLGVQHHDANRSPCSAYSNTAKNIQHSTIHALTSIINIMYNEVVGKLMSWHSEYS